MERDVQCTAHYYGHWMAAWSVDLSPILRASGTSSRNAGGLQELAEDHAPGSAHYIRLACAVHLAALLLGQCLLYSYQQNVVNGTFNIRTRSLNGALYWIAQMLGGLIMGLILDLPDSSRRMRARIAWMFLFVAGMAIWGGRYAFQKWFDRRMAQGFKQDVDYTDNSISVGPIFLYILYGAYDAFWQSFCYWLMGARSNSPGEAAITVGAYKTFQATGAAMAWRINALKKPTITQFAMDWGLCMGSFVVAITAVLAVSLTSDLNSEAVKSGDSPHSADSDNSQVELKA